MKLNNSIILTVLILSFLLIAGVIASVVFRPESATPIIIVMTSLSAVGVSTVLQLRGIKSNSAKIEDVKAIALQTRSQTNGINSVLLAQLQTLVKHQTGEVPLSTGELEAIRDNVVDAQADIDKIKGIH